MIIDIRGTHGSGKSYIPHQILAGDPNTTRHDLGHHVPAHNLFIVGHYDRTCGGCDGISTADEVCRRVRWAAKHYTHVMLEGILVAHTFKRYRDLAMELGDYHFFFLDTPLEECIRRVVERRAARGKNGFDPKNVVKDYKRIWERLRLEMTEALPDNVHVLPWNDHPVQRVLERL